MQVGALRVDLRQARPVLVAREPFTREFQHHRVAVTPPHGGRGRGRCGGEGRSRLTYGIGRLGCRRRGRGGEAALGDAAWHRAGTGAYLEPRLKARVGEVRPD
ncbi:hypothetical protein GCM10025876_17930 [Demequina litorisediminis]|uniref:Uncharacterized protein n=1 Tax=Demequina litorisediminis TaxID=1849022 RepID=A0ABQ6ICR0_9MICO|nr:hypothetical protein GCM10025876_17930 [Demequina litorisediminis]